MNSGSPGSVLAKDQPVEALLDKGANAEGVLDLLLIRHGRYADPELAGHRFIGRTDPALDQVGQNQARDLAPEVASLAAPIIFASTLRRARETAELAFPGQPIHLTELAMEIDFGWLEGLDFVDALAKYPSTMQRYPELDFTSVGGENRSDLIDRAAQLMNHFKSLPVGQTIVLVSHAYFLDAFCAVADHEPRRPYSRAFQHCVPVRMQIRI